MIRKQLHLEPWLAEYLNATSEAIGLPTNEIIRLSCCLKLIEFAKLSGYKPSIDCRRAFIKIKNSPTKETIHSVCADLAHEGRKAAEFKMQNNLFLKKKFKSKLRPAKAML